MSGYQRMVSYLYRYDKGIKGKNTGYARIERNDRRCRVTIRLQDTVSVSPSVSFSGAAPETVISFQVVA